ncbi:MAG: hypothetical protein IT381_31130 [Deltaproteobacteria bacterium]|nr:hypothetical protein [Deltaproteobacteria bacterium]
MTASSSTVIGVDFGAPSRERNQRNKIVAIQATQTAWRRYKIDASGFNARLLQGGPPGWTAAELVAELVRRPAKVVGFDFPFSLPQALLRDESFARAAGYSDGAFHGWRTFNWFVASKLLLRDPLDFSVFAPWRLKSDRARLWRRRQTDIACGGQPPLKDKFQCTFQMTLLGNAVLSRLSESGRYAIIPFPGPRRGGNDIIEVYPRATLLGRRHARLRRRRRVRRSLHRHSLPRG